MNEIIIDHDTWNYSEAKLPKAPKIELGPIHGLLPFDGVRNPSARSATSHRVFLPYQTAANNWRPQIGICESSGEAAAGLEALIHPETYDLRFQPLTIKYRGEDNEFHDYTHDLLVTRYDGSRRLMFVRNEHSLTKPSTQRQVRAIAAATPRSVADDLIIINANDYSRQRRENLFRMHRYVFDPDPEADEILLSTARGLRTLYYLQDLFQHVPLPAARAFASGYRLVARGHLRANLDNVFWEYSRVEVA